MIGLLSRPCRSRFLLASISQGLRMVLLIVLVPGFRHGACSLSEQWRAACAQLDLKPPGAGGCWCQVARLRKFHTFRLMQLRLQPSSARIPPAALARRHS
jgi:hypothetical protein